MSGIVFDKKNLVSLIDHQIALLERFGLQEEAPFSIIYFSLKKNEQIECIKILNKILRKSDALVQVKNKFFILLPATDWNGAEKLLNGIHEFLSQENQDNIVVYPEDGKSAKKLLKSLSKIVEKNTGKKLLIS